MFLLQQDLHTQLTYIYWMQSNSRYTHSKIETEDAWIADLDPIMEGGYKVAYYEPLFPMDVRTARGDGQAVSLKKIYSLRLLSLSNGEGINQLKIEISSQEDLFRLYICKIDDKQFQKLKKRQNLNFSFQALVPMLIKQINLCQKQPNNYSAVLYLNKISAHQLNLFENIEFKRIELLSLQFDEPDEQLIKNYVAFKFTKIKMNKRIIEKKLKDVLTMTKIKNQNLWADIVKKETSRVTK